jgi:hypothetical protein
VPPSAPEPETNPVPPPSPQPEPQSEPATKSKAEPVSEKPYPSAFELFKPSWAAVKLNFGTFFFVGIIPMILATIAIVPSMAMFYHNNSDPHASPITGVLLAVLALAVFLIGPALTYTQVKSAQGEKVSISEALKGGMHYFWRFYGVAILSGLLILGGFILLIVPGIFMLRRYMLAIYVLMREDLGVMQTLERSKEVSKQYSGAIWGLLGVTILISLVGVIPLVGWIASMVGSVMYYCAPAIRWEQLRKLGPAPEKA